MDKKLIVPCSGGLNACQVKGIWKSKLHFSYNPNARRPSKLQKFLFRHGRYVGYVEKPRKLFKNPRFLLKIDGNPEDSIELIIGLMVDTKKVKRPFNEATISWTSILRSYRNFRNSKKTFGGANLWIYPVPDDNYHLRSRHIMNYLDVVPRIGTKDPKENVSLEFVERVKLTPGSYILVPSIMTNLPELEFLIRVFTQCEGVSLTAL